LLPSGHLVPHQVWLGRHQAVLLLLWFHVAFVAGFAMVATHSLGHAFVETAIVSVAPVLASLSTPSRRWRSTIASLGLLINSAVLVHLAHGNIEMHFHFFVMLAVIALYQDWTAYVLSIAFVVLEHGVLGVLAPDSVFAHSAARSQPWLWALIHGGFVLAASVANLAAWKISERYTLHDPLTDLPNRALFSDLLEQTVARSVSDGERMAVLYLDLDHFKAVNDEFGHHAGDLVLIEVAERLRACTRRTDAVARLGGDEFGIILANVTEESQAENAAARILESVSAPIKVGDAVTRVGASIGIAVNNGRGKRAEVLVRNADEAMYSVKATGRSGYSLFPAGSKLEQAV
jgi:diguanylate cyclase (GGDEF)-like protein